MGVVVRRGCPIPSGVPSRTSLLLVSGLLPVRSQRLEAFRPDTLRTLLTPAPKAQTPWLAEISGQNRSEGLDLSPQWL